jgi:hypothetical protein
MNQQIIELNRLVKIHGSKRGGLEFYLIRTIRRYQNSFRTWRYFVLNPKNLQPIDHSRHSQIGNHYIKVVNVPN